jgi:endonuclease III related protein
MKKSLLKIYKTLLQHFGYRNWWPAKTKIEIIIGAILAQNTNWKNVELAISNLREAKVLSYNGLQETPVDQLAELIRPSGYYNVKAQKLKTFVEFLSAEYSGSLMMMFREETSILREKLLSVKGIGPETADSILLYAGQHLIFVSDLYTYRVMTRHKLLPEKADYHQIQKFFQDNIPEDIDLYNDFHAQIVTVGSKYCNKTPKCEECPLRELLPIEQSE